MDYEPRTPPENNVSETHPLSELATLVIGIALVTVVLTFTAAFTIDLLVQFVPPHLEARWFGAIWSDLPDAMAETSGDEGEETDPRLDQVHELLQRLAGHWPENPYEVRIAIMEEPMPNAFALPGGAIMLTEGLLDLVESENELAFVLAHELGHFAGRDHLRGLGRSLAVGLSLAVVTGGSSGDALPLLAANLTQLGFARDQESEADRFALELVEREYGHAGGATDFFEKLDALRQSGASERLGAWFLTHPLSRDRIAALELAAGRRGLDLGGEVAPLDPAFDPSTGPVE